MAGSEAGGCPPARTAATMLRSVRSRGLSSQGNVTSPWLRLLHVVIGVDHHVGVAGVARHAGDEDHLPAPVPSQSVEEALDLFVGLDRLVCRRKQRTEPADVRGLSLEGAAGRALGAPDVAQVDHQVVERQGGTAGHLAADEDHVGVFGVGDEALESGNAPEVGQVGRQGAACGPAGGGVACQGRERQSDAWRGARRGHRAAQDLGRGERGREEKEVGENPSWKEVFPRNPLPKKLLHWAAAFGLGGCRNSAEALGRSPTQPPGPNAAAYCRSS